MTVVVIPGAPYVSNQGSDDDGRGYDGSDGSPDLGGWMNRVTTVMVVDSFRGPPGSDGRGRL